MLHKINESKDSKLFSETIESVRKIITISSNSVNNPRYWFFKSGEDRSYFQLISDDKKVGLTRKQYLGWVKQDMGNLFDMVYGKPEMSEKVSQNLNEIEAGFTIIEACNAVFNSRAGNCNEYAMLGIFKLFISGFSGNAEMYKLDEDHVGIMTFKDSLYCIVDPKRDQITTLKCKPVENDKYSAYSFAALTLIKQLLPSYFKANEDRFIKFESELLEPQLDIRKNK